MNLKHLKYFLVSSLVMCTEPTQHNLVIRNMAGDIVAQSAMPEELIKEIKPLVASSEPQTIHEGPLNTFALGLFPDPNMNAKFAVSSFNEKLNAYELTIVKHQKKLVVRYVVSGRPTKILGVILLELRNSLYKEIWEFEPVGDMNEWQGFEPGKMPQELANMILNRDFITPDTDNFNMSADEIRENIANFCMYQIDSDGVYLDVNALHFNESLMDDNTELLAEVTVVDTLVAYIESSTEPKYRKFDCSEENMKRIMDFIEKHPRSIVAPKQAEFIDKYWVPQSEIPALVAQIEAIIQ